MRFSELSESYVDKINAQHYISKISDEQERIDSLSSDENISPAKFNALEKQYRAREAILMVLQRYKKGAGADSTSFFLFDINEQQELLAAIYIRMYGDIAEVKWLGSIAKGRGSQLLIKGLEQAKERGATKVRLTSKWGSEGFYDRMGFKALGKPAMNVVGDWMGGFEKEL